MTDYTVAVLEDAIRILEVLQKNTNGLSLAQITGESGYLKNKVFRILFTLEKHHFVQRNDEGLYRLGLRFLELGQHVQTSTLLLDAANPIMDWLLGKTDETIFLGVPNQKDAQCIAVRESQKSVRLYGELGRRVPLGLGGIPKTMLAFMAMSQHDQLINELCDTDDPMIERTTLLQQLVTIREDGYAIVVDEIDIGAHSIAAPIYNHQGKVIAAMSIAGPSTRFTDQNINQYIELILQATADVSEALGYVQRQQIQPL